MRNEIILANLGFALSLGLMASMVKAEPADTGHSLFHHFYQYWYNHRGLHCCDETHCRPAEFRWDAQAQVWQVQLRDGSWYTWKDTDLVIDDRGLGPFGSVCDTPEGHVFCVDPPEAGL